MHPRLRQNPVIYEIYPRSFADSNGDGVGDLPGITLRLDHLVELGVDGLWLTPIFASPQFDFGYDISDYCDIHPEFGTLHDVEQLIAEAHHYGIAVILDMVLGHTSIQHPWFRSHPDRYHWADAVPNNWLSVFGGSAWSRDSQTGRYYYHRFYPEQPSLNWANPAVKSAMHDIIRFWVDRGVDGFRLDAIDGLAVDGAWRDEPAAATTGMAGRESDGWADYWALDHIHTSNLPEVIGEIRALRTTFPETAFIVEADLPNRSLQPYVADADCAFSFEFFRAPLDGVVLGRIIDAAGRNGDLAWALSNHDFSRMVSRWGRDLARLAALLLLTLPGWSFIYQGDEIGMVDGMGGPITFDRKGRDRVRHPMQWDHHGGFTTGDPWLPMTDPAECNVAAQRGHPDAMFELYRSLIRVRRTLKGAVEIVDASIDRLDFRRGAHLVCLNLADTPRELTRGGSPVLATSPLTGAGAILPPQSGAIFRSD